MTNSSNSGLEVPGFDSRRPSSLKGGHHGVFLEDPRSSSAQSLVPSQDEYSGKRRLLVIYIHGYQGTDTSFQSFPAHVHHFLKHTLADTHVVHSKIYPRYKTYKAMDLARDNFSRWLEPHESPTTDVILVGHSMGGLLNAEVVLMVSVASESAFILLSHRITAGTKTLYTGLFSSSYSGDYQS